MPRPRPVFVLMLLFVLHLLACGSPPPASSAASPEYPDPGKLPYPDAQPPPPPLGQDAWGAAQAAALGAMVAYTDPGEIPVLKVASDGKPLPLEHTHVSAKLTGFVAEVEVAQTYKNESTKPIEAIYIFPLPENSAVNHMRMVIGQRVIEADIKERQVARRIYDAAKREGYTAALLEQERPNIFTQSVANIEPGKKIDVIIRYVQDLTYDAGAYEFVFPMVVGPRFIPGEDLAPPQAGKGTYADTTKVPDASRITPPVVGKGERSGRDISLELVADAGFMVGDFEAPTHEVVARRPADGTLRITLAEKGSIPNRDFVLRYRVAGERPRPSLILSGGEGGGFFSLMVYPPRLDIEGLVGRREIIFVVDVSGSMAGQPLSLCKMAVREALMRLRPVDTFNVITFAGSTGQVFNAPRPASAASIREGLEYVDKMVAGGGTYMANAVDVALSPEVGPGRHRYVFFLTDGYVGNETEIMGGAQRLVTALEAKGQRARVFGFGVGSSPNRYLLEGISRAGKGLAVYASAREDPVNSVNRFFHYIDRAVLTDISIDYADLGASDVFPQTIPDLFASHPVILHGRYKNAPTRPLVVRAKAGGVPIEVPIGVRRAPPDIAARGVLGSLWARSKIESLEDTMWLNQQSGMGAEDAEITKLGLEFHLVTRLTSLVAVDTSKRVSDGNPTTIVQPVDAPEGVDPTMAGAREGAPILADESPPEAVPALLAPPPSGDHGRAYGGESVDMEASSEPYEVQSRRGCGCRVGQRDSDARSVLALISAAVIAASRARRRRSPRA